MIMRNWDFASTPRYRGLSWVEVTHEWDESQMDERFCTITDDGLYFRGTGCLDGDVETDLDEVELESDVEFVLVFDLRISSSSGEAVSWRKDMKMLVGAGANKFGLGKFVGDRGVEDSEDEEDGEEVMIDEADPSSEIFEPIRALQSVDPENPARPRSFGRALGKK
ncbi:hypothetical protein CPB83DRAFT_887402 [Crepidotus variabilis]|uniref:Uncharacterized protein n=1 Tax=Crepidotus variabilis TaxID=179855 RepID=A0A9P6E550_9AGAR|nr:hypothetical protein CPB83DRAFT_887402 [Crepidotus variabilis]